MPAEGSDDRLIVVASRAVKGGKFASFTAAGMSRRVVEKRAN
jgi:tRNA U34 5-methylaminomethyl-2-thiouridine-forming methyltransferase MnmC